MDDRRDDRRRDEDQLDRRAERLHPQPILATRGAVAGSIAPAVAPSGES